MNESSPSPPEPSPEPLPYHWALAEFLQRHYAELWASLSAEQAEEEYANLVLLELNKTGQQIPEDSQLDHAVQSARSALGLEEVSITLWELPDREDIPEEAVFWILGEAHITFQKAYRESLDQVRLSEILTAALRRWQLWNGWGGTFRVAERLLARMRLHVRREETAIHESWKRWMQATDQFAGVITGSRATDEPLKWDHLDLLERRSVAEQTRQILRRLLAPAWIQTEAALAHARRFFPDFDASETASDATPALPLKDPKLRDYFCFVLLDFAAVDRELGNRSIAECLKLARELGCEERFSELLTEELACSAEQMEQVLAESQLETEA